MTRQVARGLLWLWPGMVRFAALNSTLLRFVAGFVLFIVALVAVSVALAAGRSERLRQVFTADLQLQTRQTAEAVNALLGVQEAELAYLAVDEVLVTAAAGGDSEPARQTLRRAIRSSEYLVAVCLFSPQGQLVFREAAPGDVACPERSVNTTVRLVGGVAHLDAGVRLAGGAVVVGRFVPRLAHDAIERLHSASPTRDAYLVDRRHHVLTPKETRTPTRAMAFPETRRGAQLESMGEVAVVTARVGDRDLWLRTELKVDELASLYWVPRAHLAAAVGLLVVALAVILGLIARGITRPLEETVAAANAVANGDFEQRLTMRGPTEVRLLSSALNSMSEKVQHSYEQLVSDVEERSRDLVIALDRARRLQKLAQEQAVALTDKNQVLEHQAKKLLSSQERLSAQNEILALSNDQLLRASRLKSEFLASMSHELRTPLNAVIGFSELILCGITGAVVPEQAEYLRDIHDSGRHLLALINDILDLSKIEAGQMTVLKEPVDLRLPAREAEEMVRSLAMRKSISVRLDAEQGVVCKGDLQRIRQIALNLLSNAVKFTPERGVVTIRIRRAADGAAGELVVSDTGIGIAARDQELIFEAFRQVEGGKARQYEGTGLGLALVRKFAQAMGGEVTVQSQQGEGATFTVRLPLAEPEHLDEAYEAERRAPQAVAPLPRVPEAPQERTG